MTVTQDPRTTSEIEGALDAATLTAMRERFKAEPTRRIAQNAVTRTSVDHIALNREVVHTTDHTFSTVLEDGTVTSQGQSGSVRSRR